MPVYVRSRIHFAIVDNRVLAELYTRIDPSKLTRITKETQLVMEGCPRSGNSYALAAFQYANPGVAVASHRHSATAVKTALRRQKPVILIVRPPRDTIASGLQYFPDQPPNWSITLYRRFHEDILPLADRCLVATFDDVTADFGAVVRRCNERFGTNFIPFERTDESEKALTLMLDDFALKNFTPDDLAQVSNRPSASRRSAEDLLRRLDEVLVSEIEDLNKLYGAVLLHRGNFERRGYKEPMATPIETKVQP
jgi:hypothetical protein